MANITLFSSHRGAQVPATDTRNEAGGSAYTRQPETALALYAATGCLNGTFYASAEEQLDHVLKLGNQVSAEFVAKTAIYARQRGYMKDMPALLLAIVKSFTPEAWIASISRSGMPHRPNPPAQIVMPSNSRPSSAAAASG